MSEQAQEARDSQEPKIRSQDRHWKVAAERSARGSRGRAHSPGCDGGRGGCALPVRRRHSIRHVLSGCHPDTGQARLAEQIHASLDRLGRRLHRKLAGVLDSSHRSPGGGRCAQGRVRAGTGRDKETARQQQLPESPHRDFPDLLTLVSTFLRNLIINWSILISVLIVITMLPLINVGIAYSMIDPPEYGHGLLRWTCVGLAAAWMVMVLAYIASDVPDGTSIRQSPIATGSSCISRCWGPAIY